MPEPVKLSRERWDALADYWIRLERDDRTIRSKDINHLIVDAIVETNGITFLPAEYVPGGSQRIGKVFKFSPNPCA